ncbi:DUF1642 domain-containing protein [Lactococcus lactis]|uniref:DUF1642 domain-containing protein n=1 Tax=Lactococcus lactis TaxID=1358 RepID=UPI0021A8BCD8|nr:DUF1642 domain-containing protein [Lactococcus lactis]MCT3132556.1 DUF1642 domain-containing protein [Lactococcus lactis]
MTKNDYIEKITQNLEHLTKDELKDVSILTTAQLGVRSKFAERQQLEHEIANLTPQLQQQALPVVPECVAGAIESLPEHYSAFEAISLINAKVNALPEENEDWLPVYNWLCEGIGNQNIFALAFITGKYEVEKPQLFRLKLKNTPISNYYLWLNQATGKVFVDKKFLDWTNHDNVKNIFTEQEIAKISDGAFVNNEAFELVPVEDGE